jgi:hypothetical protein
MGMSTKNGRMYYSRSVRYGKRVTSRYFGAGDMAMLARIITRDGQIERRLQQALARAEYREAVEARRVERQATRDVRERLRIIDRFMVGSGRRISQAVAGILEALGFHRHDRGQWRKRKVSTETAMQRVDVHELVRRAREGDRRALAELRYQADHELYRTAEAGRGDLGRIVDEMLVQFLEPGNGGALHKEAVLAQVAILRQELAPPGSSLIEELLAERAATCWLHVQLLELDATDLSAATPQALRRAETIDRWLSRAQARYTQALTALAKVKRLKLPVVMPVQVNVNASAEWPPKVDWPGEMAAFPAPGHTVRTE